MPVSSTETVAHIVQVALTPVFLLTAIASLLNVLSSYAVRSASKDPAASPGGGAAGTGG